MNETTTLIRYQDITAALAATQADIAAAEAHGILCGIICATTGRTDIAWEKLIFGPNKNQQSQNELKKLYATSYQQIREYSFEFTLLLPDDDIDINERAEALGLWCQGFLIGLKQGPHTIEDGASSEAVDALNDITEIAQVDHGDIASTDEDESAYFNLVEYVRLAALMLYHELKPETPASRKNSDNLLH